MKTDIQEGNKLIAEFDGLVKLSEKEIGILQTPELLYKNKEGEYISHAQLKYHSSWNDLMPVCKKFDILFDDKWTTGQRLAYEELSNEMDDAATSYEITPLYKALIEGLKWYNQNK